MLRYESRSSPVDPWEGLVAQTIYKLWQGRFTEAWHQLPQEEQQRLLGLVMQALDTVGAKELVLCSAAWSDERWPFFGVEEFPHLEGCPKPRADPDRPQLGTLY